MELKEQTTDCTQGRNLMELGISPSTASFGNKNGFPTWTIGDLIDLLPNVIDASTADKKHYKQRINQRYGGTWDVIYQKRGIGYDYLVCISSKKLIDSLYECLVWLNKNGYMDIGDGIYIKK